MELIPLIARYKEAKAKAAEAFELASSSGAELRKLVLRADQLEERLLEQIERDEIPTSDSIRLHSEALKMAGDSRAENRTAGETWGALRAEASAMLAEINAKLKSDHPKCSSDD